MRLALLFGLAFAGQTISAMAEAPELRLPIDCDVVVNLPGLAPEAGVVRWTRRGEAGIVFNRLMPLSGLVVWLQEQREGMRKTG